MAPNSGTAQHRAAVALLSLAALLLVKSWPEARAAEDPVAQRSAAEQQQDPWPGILEKSQRARSSSVYPYVDQKLARGDFAIPCLGARFCECKTEGGWNRTFWLNMASATFRGDVYVAILHRNVVWQCSVSFNQKPNEAPLKEQVVEVNQVLFCKMVNIMKKPELQDCQLIVPGASYREKHPAGYSKHFQLVGLNDPRLVSAGDESGLFLQVGCRPKVLSDTITSSNLKHLRADFRETLCLIKLQPDMAGSHLQELPEQEQQQQTASAMAARSLMMVGDPLLVGSLTPQQRTSRCLQEKDDAAQQPGLLPGMTISSKDWPLGQLLHLQPPSWMYFYEKSWVPFEYRGTLLWSRFLSPHEVVAVHANGTSTTLYSTNSKRAFRMLSSICGKGPRGNTPAVHIKAEQSGLPMDVYLGILHYTPRRGARHMSSVDRQCDEYLNFFYLMEAEPPFALLEVASSAIPIQAATNPILDTDPLLLGMGFISFPAGLLILDNKVIVTYGSGDQEVRIWQASLFHVIGSFTLTWAKHVKAQPAFS